MAGFEFKALTDSSSHRLLKSEQARLRTVLEGPASSRVATRCAYGVAVSCWGDSTEEEYGGAALVVWLTNSHLRSRSLVAFSTLQTQLTASGQVAGYQARCIHC